MKNEPKNIISIPKMENAVLLENNKNAYEKNYSKFYGQCPCCGKGIAEPKYFINSIWGSDMYPANDKNEYDDAWAMPIGNECKKRIPQEYLIMGA